MREISVIRSDTGEERRISLRALKRKEIRQLQEFGYTYLGCVPKYETAQRVVDDALDLVLSKEDQAFLDECDSRQAKDVWQALLKETYGDLEEEKN